MDDKIAAIILAGGKGERFHEDLPKQFIEINGIPIIVLTIMAFDEIKEINEIYIVLSREYIEYFKQSILNVYKFVKPINIVVGGVTRQESSYKAVVTLKDKGFNYVVIHDGVRPFADERIIKDSILTAQIIGACDVVVKTIDTIVKVQNNKIYDVLNREELCNGQTPQTFKYDIIHKAHINAREKGFENATDDVSLVRLLGIEVGAVEGDYRNIKITHKLDLEIAKLFWGMRNG